MYLLVHLGPNNSHTKMYTGNCIIRTGSKKRYILDPEECTHIFNITGAKTSTEGKIKILKKIFPGFSLYTNVSIRKKLKYYTVWCYILLKSKTTNWYFLVIFHADRSGEPLPTVGGRQDGKKGSVLVKSVYAREVVVTCWLVKRMRQSHYLEKLFP